MYIVVLSVFFPKNSQKKCLKFITKSIGDEGYNLSDKVVYYDQIFPIRPHWPDSIFETLIVRGDTVKQTATL